MQSTSKTAPRRALRALALWLGVIALMVQAVAPLCAAGMMGGANGAAGVGSIVICTAHGFETVRIGADGNPLPGTPAQDQSSLCSLCASVCAGGGFVPPGLVASEAPSSVAAVEIGFAAAPMPPRKFASAYITRGPPVSA